MFYYSGGSTFLQRGPPPPPPWRLPPEYAKNFTGLASLTLPCAAVSLRFLWEWEAEDELQEHIEPAADGFSDEGRAGGPGAGAAQEMGICRPIPAHSGSAGCLRKICFARWPALRERGCPHRHGAQQAAEGFYR